jgi:disulfide bond formation protein DsbB
MVLRTPRPPLLWALLAAGCFALVIGSFGLTAWLDLHPCHLCIFQRLLFMVLAILGALAAWRAGRPSGRLAGLAIPPLALWGAGVATYQSWLQAQPPGSISCMAAEPGLIERLVEWLGQRLPELFLATGFCEEAELIILGMTLANWALVAFLACLITAAWALLAARPGRLR